MFLLGAPAIAGDDPPLWLRQAAAASAPSDTGKAPAVALIDESRVTVNEDGRVVTVKRYAVRILAREGSSAARASEIYLTGTGTVREMRAWLIRSSGQTRSYGRDRTLDLAMVDDDIYNEVRMKAIVASNDAAVGDVFGYEVTSEDRSVFTQFEWQFQDYLPALLSRFTLTLPKGWRAEAVTFNHDKITPTVNGSSYTWEMCDLPFIEDEPASPAITNVAPRLAVSYFPPSGARAGIGRTFSNWNDVSRWLNELSEPQAELNDALIAKARALVAGAKTELERIQAICRFVQQNIRYISIQTGLGRGGGYRPHAASEVLANGYGDCKDKANLALALLKAVGIRAYLVSIYSGDPTYVREEWPSPQQFNHCILAVKLSDETQASAIVMHPGLGRLLIFDPTDTETPVGDLPDDEQNSLALVVAGEAGALLRMPATPPEANRLERQTEIALAADGSITAGIRERAIGQSAVAFRRELRHLSRSEYVKLIETWVARDVTGAKVSKIEQVDDASASRFTLDVEFTAQRYPKLMQPGLMAFQPVVVERRAISFPTNEPRHRPVVLEAQAYTEAVRVKLPAEFKVDEIPAPVKLEAPFGNYSTTYEVKESHLLFTRSLVVRAATIPVEQYARARDFFRGICSAEQDLVVLVKK
jgi:transglutaminase-like putative cysteine protease